MRDVGKRTAVHNCRCVFQRLHQVRLDGVFEQQCHCSNAAKIFRKNGTIIISVGNQNIAEALFQVLNILGKAENRHDFARYRNHKGIFARNTVNFSAQPYVDKAQSAVVHVHAAFKKNPPLVDSQLVSLLEVIVNDGTQQVVCRCDGVHVPCEMKIDFLHRHDLRVSAARSTAFDAEDRTERRLTQRDDRFFSDLFHGLTQTDRCGSFSFTSRCGVDSGYQNQLPVRTLHGRLVK